MIHRNHDELLDEEILVPEGYQDTQEFIRKNTILGLLTVRDLLYATVLGIMGGFISSLIPFSLIMKALYPFWGGSQLLSGHHLIWMSISYGTTKKKSGLLVTALIKGIIEFLLGDSLGAFIIGMNFLEGISLIFGFFLIERLGEYKTNFGWAIAGGIGNVTQAPIFWAVAGRFGILHWSLAAIAFTFAFISGCFITGFLGRLITISIKRSMGELRYDTPFVEFHIFGNVLILLGIISGGGFIIEYIVKLLGYSGYFLHLGFDILLVFFLLILLRTTKLIRKIVKFPVIDTYWRYLLLFVLGTITGFTFYYVASIFLLNSPTRDVIFMIHIAIQLVLTIIELLSWIQLRKFGKNRRYSFGTGSLNLGTYFLILATSASLILYSLELAESFLNAYVIIILVEILGFTDSMLNFIGFFVTGYNIKRFKGEIS